MVNASRLTSIKYDESCAIDFYVKERIQKLIFAREFGEPKDMGDPVFGENPDAFSILSKGMRELSDVRVKQYCFSYDEAECIDDDISLLSFENICALFNCIVMRADGSIKNSDAEIVDQVRRYRCCDLTMMDIKLMYSLLHSYRLYLRGKKRLALRKGVFRELCRYLAVEHCPFDGELSLYFIADNLVRFMSFYTVWGEEETFHYIAYSSKEITYFDEYKDNLPSNIRKKAEDYLGVFFKPSVHDDSFVEVKRYGDETLVLFGTSIFNAYDLPYSDGDDFPCSDDEAEECMDRCCDLFYEDRYVNPYFDTALRWLNDNLKDLRLTYSSKEAAA